jgi:hypothetical protein
MTVGWRPFSFDVIDLATLDDKIGGDSGLVYSTSPQKAIGKDDESYIVKGPDTEVVFAELAGCLLADAVGITVPIARACRISNVVLAGSREVSNLRLVEPWIGKPHKVINYAEIFAAIVVDVWLGNVDRNMGNVIGEPVERDQIEFVFIDFEKSAALRRYPLVSTTLIDPRQLWPSNQLGRSIMNEKPLHPPGETMQRIQELNSPACLQLIQPVIDALGLVDWVESSVEALARRARDIQPLTEEVWNP